MRKQIDCIYILDSCHCDVYSVVSFEVYFLPIILWLVFEAIFWGRVGEGG